MAIILKAALYDVDCCTPYQWKTPQSRIFTTIGCLIFWRKRLCIALSSRGSQTVDVGLILNGAMILLSVLSKSPPLQRDGKILGHVWPNAQAASAKAISLEADAIP
jgi:hypothetical protein